MCTEIWLPCSWHSVYNWVSRLPFSYTLNQPPAAIGSQKGQWYSCWWKTASFLSSSPLRDEDTKEKAKYHRKVDEILSLEITMKSGRSFKNVIWLCPLGLGWASRNKKSEDTLSFFLLLISLEVRNSGLLCKVFSVKSARQDPRMWPASSRSKAISKFMEAGRSMKRRRWANSSSSLEKAPRNCQRALLFHPCGQNLSTLNTKRDARK